MRVERMTLRAKGVRGRKARDQAPNASGLVSDWADSARFVHLRVRLTTSQAAAPTTIERKMRTSLGKAVIDQNRKSIEVDSRFWRMMMATSKKKTN